MRVRVCLLMAALVLGLAACQPTPPAASSAPVQPPAAAKVEQAPEAGATVEQTAQMPALAMTAVDGTAYDLAAHRGKWVVVNFWATWCAPCIKEMPELSALHAMRENIEVVGLAYEDIEPADMQAFLAKRPVAYPIIILDPYSPPQDFATPRGLPMTYLIDPTGTVARQFLGPVTAKDIEAAIAGAAV